MSYVGEDEGVVGTVPLRGRVSRGRGGCPTARGPGSREQPSVGQGPRPNLDRGVIRPVSWGLTPTPLFPETGGERFRRRPSSPDS